MPKSKFVSERDLFVHLAQTISQISGVQLGQKQDSMIETRLRKHLRSTGNMTPEQYWIYFQANEEQEVQKLISLLTTHHTFFFREPTQFDFLIEMLPAYLKAAMASRQPELVFHSAACSLGHEGYTLAMILNHHLKAMGSTMPWRIVFNDIDPESVAVAQAGVYRNEDLVRVPKKYIEESLILGKGTAEGFSKIKPELAKHCQFAVKNLKSLNAENCPRKAFDFVFCRNVFIYFSHSDVESIVNHMTPTLRDNGCFFIGISEKLSGIKTGLVHLGSSIYQKKAS